MSIFRNRTGAYAYRLHNSTVYLPLDKLPLIFSALLLVIAGKAISAPSGTSPHPSPLPTVESSTLSKSWHLSQILNEMDATQRLRDEVATHCVTAQQKLHWKNRLAELDAKLDQPLDELSGDRLNNATLVQLFELERHIGADRTDIDHSSEDMTHSVSILEDDYDKLKNEVLHWQTAQTMAKDRSAPDAITNRITNLIKTLQLSQNQLLALRDGLLIRLDRISELRQRMTAIQSEITERRNAIEHQVRTAATTPIWQKILTRADLERAIDIGLAQTHNHISVINAYWHESWPHLCWIGLSTFTFIYLLLLRGAQLIGQNDATYSSELDQATVRNVIQHPLLSAISLSLLVLAYMAPNGPSAFYDLLNLALPPLVALTLHGRYGQYLHLSLISFIICYLPVLFWGLLELLPVLDHWVLLIQGLIFGSCVAWDFRQGHWRKAFPKFPPILLRLILFWLLGSLVSGVVASIMGYLGFARVAIWAMIILLGDIAVFGCAAAIVYSLCVVFFNLPLVEFSLTLPQRRQRLLGWLRAGLMVGVGVYVFQDALKSYNLLTAVISALEYALLWRAPVDGEVLTAAQILLASAILAGTWLSIKALQVLMEEELFPRFQLPLGLPFAISAITRYLVGLLGMVWAMAALGFDLTRVTLLAGALGVGIGFGLQNIFNNFACGLILLFERPINVGDIIEMGPLVGIVRRIGIRSSTIRTLQGAEVILPNAELIAKPVINWTLSDRLRRMEIDLAVKPSGAGVEDIIHILEEVARESSEVLPEPPLYGLFTGFSDGNLNFRLCAWINRYENEQRIASSIRRAVLARFDAASICIPNHIGTFYLNSADPLKPKIPINDRTGSANFNT